MADANRRGDATILIDETQDAIAAATRANVNIYAIDPRGLTSLGDDAIQMAGAAAQRPDAQASGSRRSRTSCARRRTACGCSPRRPAGSRRSPATTSPSAFQRIVDENSSYYVLGYYPANEKRDGRFRKIDVRLTRPGPDRQGPEGLCRAARRQGRRPSAKVDPSAGTSNELRDALNSPLQTNGLKLAVFAAPLKGAGAEGRGGHRDADRWAATSRSPRRTASTSTRSSCRTSPSTRTARSRPATATP